MDRILIILIFAALSTTKTFSQIDKVQYTYDSQNRIKTVMFPNGNTETYYYDKVGNRISQINVEQATSINDLDSIVETFKVFPNPTSGIFNVTGTTENAQDFQIIFYDQAGKMLYERNVTDSKYINEKINVTDIAIGSYILVIKSKGRTKSWNIIKI